MSDFYSFYIAGGATLDAQETDVDRLAWMAGVVFQDTELIVGVKATPEGYWVQVEDPPNFGPYSFDAAWAFLDGVLVGASQAASDA